MNRVKTTSEKSLLTVCLASAASVLISATAMADSWKIDPRCFLNGASGTFDSVAVKDPSIVYSGGAYHLFYTSRSSTAWGLGYATASSITGLKTATHRHLTTIGSSAGLAAPQVLYFPIKGKWYLIFQNGTTPSYSVNSSVSGYGSWSAAQSMGFSDGGIDYFCISESAYTTSGNVYVFYAANDGSHQIKRRSTTIANFPTGWGAATVVATGTFEAPHVYKNAADGKFYMMCEDLGRYYELWSASSLGGTWTKQQEQWAYIGNCTFAGEVWTSQVSHGEILRQGVDANMIINSISSPQILIQGTTGTGTYANLPYNLGLMHK